MSQGDIEPQHSGVVLASPAESVAECLDKMAKGNIGSILIAEDGKILGIVTERDLLKHWRKLSDAKFLESAVTSIATKTVFSMSIKDIAQAPKEMIARRIRHVPLVDDDGRVVGMMSMRDILKAMVQAAGGVRLEAKKATTSKGVAAVPGVLHILTPTAQLSEICRRFIPSNWRCETWNSVDTLIDRLEKLEPRTLAGTAFMLDLDGVADLDWRALITKLIGMMKRTDRPEIFIVTSEKKFSPKDKKTIEMVAEKAKWTAYQRPLPVAAVSAALGELGEAKKR